MRDMRVMWVCGCVEWRGEKKTKNAGTTMKSSQNMTPFFGVYVVYHGPTKSSENGHFSRRICLHMFPMFAYVIRQRVLIQTPKNASFFAEGSHSKGPNHALEKVLTNETPSKAGKPSIRGPASRKIVSSSVRL